ncbi:MAG TPA: Ig-like domain-containing protein, partial [Blastocatellia bacterium]|nr:Ig-like domain-containing protein [Blastocatellia bacterium]
FSVNVTGITPGVKNNVTGNITANESGPGGTASASISVGSRATTTSLTFSANPMASGQTVQVTATVVDTDAGVKSNPTGTVSFSAGSDVLNPTSCSLTPVAATTDTSTCQINLTSTTIGTHTVTGNYGGSAIHSASSGNAQLTVNKANTSSALVSSANPSVFGQSVTFTVTVSAVAPGAGTPTGAVTFLDGVTPIGSAPLNGSGAATITISNLSVETHPISTTYPGDGNFNGGTSNTVNQVVNKAATTTALTSNVNPSDFGQNVTFTATVAANAPGAGAPIGTVTFFDGATQIGTGTLNGSGVATFSTTALSVGTHSITATFGGDGNFNGSTSSAVNQVVNKAPTATALTSSVNPSVFGQPVTFTATVTSIAPPINNSGPAVRRRTGTVASRTQTTRAVTTGTGTPSGTVTFFDGATQIGTGTLNGSGVATLTISTLSVGQHSITAVYSGDDNFNSSTSPIVTQTVNKANTATANVTSSVNPSVFGQSVTFSTTVTAVAPGAGTPTGIVTFKDGAAILGTSTLDGSGQASFTTSALIVGSHSITASYGGDGNFNGSSSAAITQTVNRATTTTMVTTSANPVFIGQTVTFTATVVPTAPGGGAPTGTVQFKDNGINIGGPVTLSGGVAAVVQSCLTPGLHTITAIFSGDPNFTGSTGTLAGGQNVGFIFTDTVTGNQLIVTVPANGQSGNGTYTWISNGTTIVSNVPAMIEFNSQTLRIRTNSPSMNALFDATTHTGQAVLFDTVRNKSFILNTVSFSLESTACSGGS